MTSRALHAYKAAACPPSCAREEGALRSGVVRVRWCNCFLLNMHVASVRARQPRWSVGRLTDCLQVIEAGKWMLDNTAAAKEACVGCASICSLARSRARVNQHFDDAAATDGCSVLCAECQPI